VTRLLQALGLRVLATEPAAAMLRQALALDGSDGTAHYLRADAAHLPARSGSFDAAVAGWVFGHQIEWRPSDWRATIGGFLAECERVTDGGRIVVIETLGTGHETPHPPPDLVGYYSWLENDLGFVREWIRTDYVFGDVETAAKTTGHFFGPEFAETVRSRRWARIPECTGIWTHRGRR
ncbi:MAG: class I SAM-dependent methyltransferase, partial [Acidimicrobiia bacterium]|nr:class I SAM-dependent methyltransferase [Acidimicrobiia bacterium]